MKWVRVISVVLFLTIAYQPQGFCAPPDRTVQTIEKSFPLHMGGKLVLDLDTGGSVEIRGWDKPEVAVTVDIGGDDADEVNVEFDQRPSCLTIHSDCDAHWHVDLDMNFTIEVPEKCDVQIDSNGGEVTIIGVEGKLSGETLGGALELDRVKGRVSLETMGGSVTVEDSDVDGKVSTMGGEVVIRNVKGDLKGSTMGGSVTYDNVTGRSAESRDEETHVSTMGGDINVGKTDRKITAKTMGGDIEVESAEEVNMTTMGGDIDIGDAPAGAKVSTMGGDITIRSAGKRAEAKTMGGDIEIRAIDGRVSANTMGGDVTVTMVGDPAKGDRDVDLSSMGGDIELTVPAALSMKFDIEIKYTKKHKRPCRIQSDFPMNIEETPNWERDNWIGQPHKRIFGTGEVGGGKHLIKIRTTNGSVIIRKGA